MSRMNKIEAKQTVEAILDLSKVRKAASQAKSKLNDKKRDLKWAEDGVKYAQSRVVGTTEYDNAEAIAKHVADQTKRVEQAKAALVKAEAEFAKVQAELAAAEAAKVVTATQFDATLAWFSGVSLNNARDALALLDASVKAGCWLPGASRKVRAAMGKCNVAKKTVKTNYVGKSWEAPKAVSAIDYAKDYGSFDGLAKLTAADLQGLPETAVKFVTDFQPMVRMMDKLDATRPVPTFTLMNASPLISNHLKSLGVTKVDICPMKFEEVEEKDEKGRTYYRTVVTLLWPEGTKHHTSKFAWGTNHNAQCHACGHAIKNNYNWVPMVLTTKNGLASYWVGRDCAETLFGVKLTGELEIKVDGSR